MKRRGPLTLLYESRRIRWTVGVLLAVIVIGWVTVVVRSQFRGLRARLSRVAPGMTREEVEHIFGPPVLTLNRRPAGSGELLVWVDQLWQVDIVVDGNGKVVRCGMTPSNSALRRTAGRLVPP